MAVAPSDDCRNDEKSQLSSHVEANFSLSPRSGTRAGGTPSLAGLARTRSPPRWGRGARGAPSGQSSPPDGSDSAFLCRKVPRPACTSYPPHPSLGGRPAAGRSSRRGGRCRPPRRSTLSSQPPASHRAAGRRCPLSWARKTGYSPLCEGFRREGRTPCRPGTADGLRVTAEAPHSLCGKRLLKWQLIRGNCHEKSRLACELAADCFRMWVKSLALVPFRRRGRPL